jgi:hypothetical protein
LEAAISRRDAKAPDDQMKISDLCASAPWRLIPVISALGGSFSAPRGPGWPRRGQAATSAMFGSTSTHADARTRSVRSMPVSDRGSRSTVELRRRAGSLSSGSRGPAIPVVSIEARACWAASRGEALLGCASHRNGKRFGAPRRGPQARPLAGSALTSRSLPSTSPRRPETWRCGAVQTLACMQRGRDDTHSPAAVSPPPYVAIRRSDPWCLDPPDRRVPWHSSREGRAREL